jgi:antitoxin YefM
MASKAQPGLSSRAINRFAAGVGKYRPWPGPQHWSIIVPLRVAGRKMVPFLVPYTEDGPMAITASEARKNLFPLIEQVNEDRTPVEITSRRGDAVLISRADYDSLEATAHLLRAPANARRLLESLQQALAGQRDEHELDR